MKKILTNLIPHFFAKEPIPEITNLDLVQTIQKLHQSTNTTQAIQIALDILSTKYKSQRLQTYLKFYKWFETDPNRLWQRNGFMHCTQLNYLFRVLMIESGFLTDSEIQLGYSLVGYISPHQYLKVLVNNKWIAIDPWHYDLNQVIGKYAHGFGMKALEN